MESALSVGVQMARAMEYFVARSSVPLLVAGARSASDPADSAPKLRAPTPLDIEALLLARSAGSISINGELVDVASSDLPFDGACMQRFFLTYVDLASNVDFRDFEPAPLPLRKGGRRDIYGQSRRRQHFYARAFRVKSRRALETVMPLIAENWANSLDPARPSLVLRTVEAVTTVVQWMNDIGFRRGEISVSMFSVPSAEVAVVKQLEVLTTFSEHGHQRYKRIGLPPEYSVTSAGSGQLELPMERDFQRAIFALLCWHRSGLGS